MTNLISAQFSRLFRSKIFYASLVFFAGLAVYFMGSTFLYYGSTLNLLSDMREYPERFTQEFTYHISAEMYMGLSFIAFGVIAAVLISLLIGREFSDGTIRNKLISGYSRTAIYVSNLIVCIAAEIMMQLVYSAVILIQGLILLIKFKIDGFSVPLFYEFKDTFLFQLIGLGIMAVYASVFLFFAMISASRVRTAVAAILTILIMLVLSEAVNQELYPSYYHITTESNTSEEDYSDKYINYNDYIEAQRGKNLSGIKLNFYCFLDDALPTRQAAYILECDGIPPRTSRYVMYDFGAAIAASACGLLIFKRKELK